jgi:hypothetical protein
MAIDALDVTFTYEEHDVVSAQRLRFRHSPRLRILAGLGVIALLVPLAQRLLPGTHDGMDVPLLVGLAAIFLLVPVLTYLLGPLMDYRRNRFWRTPLSLRLSAAGLRLAVAAAPPGQNALEIAWSHLHHLLENDDVLILFFGAQESYVIVPKRLLSAGGQRVLQDLLSTAGPSSESKDG